MLAHLSSGGAPMVSTLSKLVDMIQEGAIPSWLAAAILERRDEIAQELQRTGLFVLKGPDGEEVEIHAENQHVAA